MSIVNVVGVVPIIALVLAISWFLADLIVPQSEIDKIEAIERWAKEELERRETEGEDG
jgi:di/tricarboxylate transporter